MGRRELTVDGHWAEFLESADGDCRVGVWSIYVVSTDLDAGLTVDVDPGQKLRTLRRFKRHADGSAVTQTNVYERRPHVAFQGEIVERPDGCVQQQWVVDREDCCRPDGLIHPVASGPIDQRFFISRSFPDKGVHLALWAGLRLPSVSMASPPGVFSGEVNLVEDGGNISTTFAYTKVGTELGDRYLLSGIGEIQEENGPEHLVEEDVDFDALDWHWREEQLPRDPAEWMAGWSGRMVTMKIDDGRMWVSEAEAAWKAPDPSDSSMALVLTGGEGYFYGPRVLVPVGAGTKSAVVFEAGKRISDVLFHRVVWRYNEEGRCVRIDHELYSTE